MILLSPVAHILRAERRGNVEHQRHPVRLDPSRLQRLDLNLCAT